MLTLLLTICLLYVACKLGWIAVKAGWGLLKIGLSVFIILTIVGMLVEGLIRLAIPVLLVVGLFVIIRSFTDERV